MRLTNLEILNLPPGSTFNNAPENFFIINTCQRVIIISDDSNIISKVSSMNKFEYFKEAEAYQFLLETVCGLKSKILGEYEIVSQFKKAYQNYVKLSHRSGNLIKIIEKIFKDSKEVRTEHLLGIGQHSYSGISKKLMFQIKSELINKNAPILILGTGDLAEDLVQIIYKKNEVIISGRNQNRLQELQAKLAFNTIDWNRREEFFQYPFMINTIGTHETLFNESFFNSWNDLHKGNAVFIDLGSPSAIKTKLDSSQNVLRLDDILCEAEKLSQEKLIKIRAAREHINLIMEKRVRLTTSIQQLPLQLSVIY